MFRKDQVAIHVDIEYALTGGNEFERIDGVLPANGALKPGDDFLRQTGGAGCIVSIHAERDLDLHVATEVVPQPR